MKNTHRDTPTNSQRDLKTQTDRRIDRHTVTDKHQKTERHDRRRGTHQSDMSAGATEVQIASLRGKLGQKGSDIIVSAYVMVMVP